MTALLGQEGLPKNAFARKYLAYDAQRAIVVGRSYYSVKSLGSFVYRVQMRDGTILQLTEDCLAAGEALE